jgi:valyl-tRNA synthetase
MPESIMIAPWPDPGMTDPEATEHMESVMEVVRAIRATRSEYRVEPAKYVPATLVRGEGISPVEEYAEMIGRLARVRPLNVVTSLQQPPPGSVALLIRDLSVHLPLAEMTDLAVERDRLQKELSAAMEHLASARARLGDERFVSRAPTHVVERERERARSTEERAEKLRRTLESLTP